MLFKLWFGPHSKKFENHQIRVTSVLRIRHCCLTMMSLIFTGMIGSLFSFLQFVNSPLFGAASDVYGRKPMILTSLIGSSVAYVFWACSDSFLLFLIARTIAGISEANVSISTAVIADLKSDKARSKGMVRRLFFNRWNRDVVSTAIRLCALHLVLIY